MHEADGSEPAAGMMARIHGTWRSLVSALVWGTRGRRFKSGRPDGYSDMSDQREGSGWSRT